jgi:hypothetical protein
MQKSEMQVLVLMSACALGILLETKNACNVCAFANKIVCIQLDLRMESLTRWAVNIKSQKNKRNTHFLAFLLANVAQIMQ